MPIEAHLSTRIRRGNRLFHHNPCHLDVLLPGLLRLRSQPCAWCDSKQAAERPAQHRMGSMIQRSRLMRSQKCSHMARALPATRMTMLRACRTKRAPTLSTWVRKVGRLIGEPADSCGSWHSAGVLSGSCPRESLFACAGPA